MKYLKAVVFLLTLLLVIGLSTGTAHAQCSAPVSNPWISNGQFLACTGNGQIGDYPYGDTDAYSTISQCSYGPPCGQCYSPYTPLQSTGICYYPPCSGSYENDTWIWWLYVTGSGEYATEITGCYYTGV